MKLTLINQGSVPTPMMSKDEGGWARILEPGVRLYINQPSLNYLVIGEKSDVVEAIKDTFLGLAKILSVWKEKSERVGQERLINVLIQNDGDRAVQVEDRVIIPYDRYAISGKDYIEVRQIGG